MKRIPFCVIFSLILICNACAPRLPKAAYDLAISALCDFPPVSGNNMCRRVEITHIVTEDLPYPRDINDENMRRWCVELIYIDYTGERGSACIWLAGPDAQGEYLIRKGPEYDVSCLGSP